MIRRESVLTRCTIHGLIRVCFLNYITSRKKVPHHCLNSPQSNFCTKYKLIYFKLQHTVVPENRGYFLTFTSSKKKLFFWCTRAKSNNTYVTKRLVVTQKTTERKKKKLLRIEKNEQAKSTYDNKRVRKSASIHILRVSVSDHPERGARFVSINKRNVV